LRGSQYATLNQVTKLTTSSNSLGEWMYQYVDELGDFWEQRPVTAANMMYQAGCAASGVATGVPTLDNKRKKETFQWLGVRRSLLQLTTCLSSSKAI